VSGGANNVLGGKDGNVYRKQGQDWQARDGNQWKTASPAAPATRPTTPATRPTTPAARPTTPATRPAPVPADVTRDYQSRERGQQQAQKYNNGAGRAPQSSQPRQPPQSRPTPSGGAGGRR